MSNRKIAEDFVIKEMTDITPDGGNGLFYKQFFSGLSDEQFEDFVVRLEKGQEELAVWLSNTNRKRDIDFEDMVERCRRLGRECFKRIISVDTDTGLKTMTKTKHFVGSAELMQQSQMWLHKISTAKDDSQIEDSTGQVMMDSRATSLSAPELSVLAALKLYNCANELYTVKGGDVLAAKAYRADLVESGKTTTNSCLRRGGVAKSLRTLHFLLRARGIDNNVNKRYG